MFTSNKRIHEQCSPAAICHSLPSALNYSNTLPSPIPLHPSLGADSVWVSTDDAEIGAAAAQAGAHVHRRSAATCTDAASSLSAVLEFLGDRPGQWGLQGEVMERGGRGGGEEREGKVEIGGIWHWGSG